MRADALIKKIRAHKGKLLVPMHGRDGVVHVALEKKDLIEQLTPYKDRECGYTMLKMDDGYYTIEAEH